MSQLSSPALRLLGKKGVSVPRTRLGAFDGVWNVVIQARIPGARFAELTCAALQDDEEELVVATSSTIPDSGISLVNVLLKSEVLTPSETNPLGVTTHEQHDNISSNVSNA